VRVSASLRYREPFTVPGSFSRRYGAPQLASALPSGPPLLFDGSPPALPVHLGSRRHLFIDGALLDTSSGVSFAASTPVRIDELDFDQGLGDASVVDDGGNIVMYYGGWLDALRRAVSTDGLHFDRPETGVREWGGSTGGLGGDALFRLPGHANVFKDGNPLAPASERFKATAFIMTRGIYALTSADGIHWRRNETIMLPFDCGGGAESFWDDQRGAYVCHLRHEGYYARTGDMRRIASRAESTDFFAPWPFEPDPAPVPRKAFTLPALWEELPMPFVPTADGQVYRTRAIKYQWAPDVYLAFIWRYDPAAEVRQTELAVSRDNRRWTTFGTAPAYLPAGLPFGDGRRANAALAAHGLVRRHDEIWQYAEVCEAGHGGPGIQRVVRVTQRLDGFVSLAATRPGGWAVTHPLIFEGAALELNVAASGSVRVGLLDTDGQPIAGFSSDASLPITTDATHCRVRWQGGDDVSSLAGRAIRLRFELEDARLYAFQFTGR